MNPTLESVVLLSGLMVYEIVFSFRKMKKRLVCMSQLGQILPWPGNTYTLIVNIQNKQYEAQLTVAPLKSIDSLTYEFVPQSTTQEEGYYLSFYFQDPIATKNYYYWEVLKNGELISDQEIHITDDATVNGTNIEIELTDYPFQQDDVAEVRLHTITKETFEYYQALKLLVDAGSPAQSVPENPISNIKDVSSDGPNQVIGYFNATLSSSKSIVIE